jgi:DNA primase
MSGFVSFPEVKAANTIESVAQYLGLKVKSHGETLRCECPVHGGGDRSLVITPRKSLFYCFAPDGKDGGDQIQLLAHVRQIGAKEAAQELLKLRAPSKPAPEKPPHDRGGAMQPLEHLDPSHVAVATLGLSETLAKDLGIGFTTKGLMKGTVAIPVKERDGSLVGYVGVTRGEQPRTARSYDPSKIIFNADRLQKGQSLHLTDDPVKCLIAHDMGMQCVAFLSGITAQQLSLLSILMEEHEIATAQLL